MQVCCSQKQINCFQSVNGFIKPKMSPWLSKFVICSLGQAGGIAWGPKICSKWEIKKKWNPCFICYEPSSHAKIMFLVVLHVQGPGKGSDMQCFVLSLWQTLKNALLLPDRVAPSLLSYLVNLKWMFLFWKKQNGDVIISQKLVVRLADQLQFDYWGNYS